MDGSVRVPTPQGIAAPPGCVVFVGVVVLPSAPAMVKRVPEGKYARGVDSICETAWVGWPAPSR